MYFTGFEFFLCCFLLVLILCGHNSESKVCSVASGLPYVFLTSLKGHVAVVVEVVVGGCWGERVLLVNWAKEIRNLNILVESCS
jgi:hypothetical protein